MGTDAVAMPEARLTDALVATMRAREHAAGRVCGEDAIEMEVGEHHLRVHATGGTAAPAATHPDARAHSARAHTRRRERCACPTNGRHRSGRARRLLFPLPEAGGRRE